MSMHSTPTDPAQSAIDRTIDRDRRIIKGLMIGSAILWLVVLGAVAWLLQIHFNSVAPRLEAMRRAAEESGTRADAWSSSMDTVIAYGVAITVGLVGLLALLTAGVVALLFASRRATLRQINASLLQLSRQLHEIQQEKRGISSP
jgi:hypothetical protein